MPQRPTPGRDPRRGSASPAGSSLLQQAPWRALGLLAALALAAWIVIPPFAGWWTQRAQIAEVRAQAEQEDRAADELVEERRRLQDDAHVREVARARLDYAEPGERRYHVLTSGEIRPDDAEDVPDAEDRAWYDTVWGSIEDAGAGVAEEPGTSEDEPPGEAPSSGSSGSGASGEPTEGREVDEEIPEGVPSLITDDDFDPEDIPSSDLGETETPTVEGAQ
ncbi:Cell division protein FtsB [Kytococcus aerolatus]|uniref:Cell division protein FtsB n=1 Tax=Kytococcus aerolatus TaxID=592308 RepID=A0A212U7T7_9MICO|nr:septum formation initiator family protein [Kytococcus aerolatus]SNC74322.1 Cell division protein FtsB [Kytococcus aerolatus]